MKPVFFLITFVKDGRKYINTLFNSLLSQTRINFKHYIYDDGSCDPIEDLVDEYRKKASSLKIPYEVIYEKNIENKGVNYSTMHCISKADCEYFIWLNCDDCIDERFFEEMEKCIIKNKKPTVVRSNLYDFVSKKQIEKDRFRLKVRKQSRQLKYFLYGTFSCNFFAIKTSDWFTYNPHNHYYEERSFFNDEQVLLTCCINNSRFAFCENATGYFYNHGNNESNMYKEKDLEIRYSFFKKLIDCYDKKIGSIVFDILELRRSFNQMEKYLNESNRTEALKVYKQRKTLCEDKRIPRLFWYRYGNNLTWLVRILIRK